MLKQPSRCCLMQLSQMARRSLGKFVTFMRQKYSTLKEQVIAFVQTQCGDSDGPVKLPVDRTLLDTCFDDSNGITAAAVEQISVLELGGIIQELDSARGFLQVRQRLAPGRDDLQNNLDSVEDLVVAMPALIALMLLQAAHTDCQAQSEQDAQKTTPSETTLLGSFSKGRKEVSACTKRSSLASQVTKMELCLATPRACIEARLQHAWDYE